VSGALVIPEDLPLYRLSAYYEHFGDECVDRKRNPHILYFVIAQLVIIYRLYMVSASERWETTIRMILTSNAVGVFQGLARTQQQSLRNWAT
jgi:hypothetical protein